MRLLDALIATLDAATALFGKAIAWLVLFMVVVTFFNVVTRYVYGVSVIALYESVLYAFAMVLTGAAGWALMHDEHVRVDIFYRGMGPRAQAVVNMLGCVFLLGPVLWLIWTRGYPYVLRSWRLGEGSNEIAGLPFLYVLKSFILVFVVVLAVQGLSFLLKNLRTLLTGEAPPTPVERHARHEESAS